MLKNIIFSLLLLSCSTTLLAQKDIIKSIESIEPGKGRVKIYQDPAIAELLSSTKAELVEKGDVKMLKTPGYRIQVYAGNNTREAKQQAEKIAEEMTELFPDLSIYTPFLSPRWICRVGDFTSIEEADAMLRQIRKLRKFREVAIVREQVLIPID